MKEELSSSNYILQVGATTPFDERCKSTHVRGGGEVGYLGSQTLTGFTWLTV